MKQGKRTGALDSRGRRVRGIFVRDGIYIAGYKHDRRWRMVKLNATTITEARRERESLLAGLREGRTPAPNTLTFERAFEEYQDSRVLAQRTLGHERHLLDRHLADLKHRRIQDVTPTEVARRLRELRGSYAEWTCVGVYRVLLGTFALAVRRGLLSRSPLDALSPSERPKQRNAKPVARLDPAELAKLVHAGSTKRWRAALGLAAWAGLRLGELRGLRWADVDLVSGVLHVRRSLGRDGTPQETKTDAGQRAVPLFPELRTLLVKWKLEAEHSQESDYLLSTVDGHPVSERNLRRVLDHAKVDAGLDQGVERLSWHSLRHSFASMLATELGLPPTRLAEIIGHTDPGFTLRAYARDTADTATIVADVLARARAAGFGQ
jgi:integrase